MSAITLTNVKKRYASQQVIHGVNVEIETGEFIVIVGPSGCGKSTLLRMIAGLETITEGEIQIGGKVVNDLEPKDRDIAMVFQNYALYPHMNVYDNMAYGLKIRGIARAEIYQRVQQAARILGLGDLLDRRPGQLSGGQRQRVAMGRAIVRKPRAFLFDEPLSNLDAKLRVQMRLEIQKLHRELATTSIFVTHDQVEAMTLAQRMIVMNAGRVEQIGAPLAVYDDPASVFVAGFIGSPPMSFLPGKVWTSVVQIGAGLSVPLPAALQQRFPQLHPITVGVRPEHVDVTREPGLPLVVETVEALGAETLVHGRLGGSALVVRQAGYVMPRAGETLNVLPRVEKLYFFDAKTGVRLK